MTSNNYWGRIKKISKIKLVKSILKPKEEEDGRVVLTNGDYSFGGGGEINLKLNHLYECDCGYTMMFNN